MSCLAIVLFPGVRSRAYLQMMLRAGLAPDHAIVLGDPGEDRHDPGWGAPPQPDFDPHEDLRTTLRRGDVAVEFEPSLDVNGSGLLARLASLAPDWVVFTGGGILGRAAFEAAPRWLHVHPGWLPDHRGSTCLHYGLLLRGKVGVSALVLQRELDTGPILARREFEPDPAWSAASLDHAADAWMRARVLLDALRGLRDTPPPTPIEQDPREGTTFYVIHPVLKHLALESLALRGVAPSQDPVPTR